MRDLTVYLVIMPVAFVAGVVVGGLIIARYILKKQKKQMEEWQKKMEEPDKKQVKNMLTALGQKPSEEQVNRFINMSKSADKKKKPKPKKTSLKKKK